MLQRLLDLLRSLLGFWKKKEDPVAPKVKDMPVIVDVPSRLYTKQKGGAGKPDIRVFDVTAVNDAIDRHVSMMEPHETVVAIAHVDLKGGRLAVVGKVPDALPGEAKWTVYTEKEWDGDWKAGAAVRWSI